MIKRIVALIIMFCFMWQCIVYGFKLPAFILPTPLDVLYALWQYKLLLAQESIPTIIETLLGFGIGI